MKRAAYRDLRMTTALMGLVVFGIPAAAGGGDGDDDTVKTLRKELAKYSQELTFYYLPSSAVNMLKNPFPVTSYYTNLGAFFDNVFKLTYNYDRAHPAKYFYRSLPLSSFFVQYMPLFDKDLAKDWNISVNTNLFNR